MRRALVSILYVIEWEKPLAIKSILTQCRTLLYIISIDLRPSINSQSNTHTHTQIRLTQSVTATNCVTLWLMLNFFFISFHSTIYFLLVIYCHHLSIFIEFLWAIFIAIYEYWSFNVLFYLFAEWTKKFLLLLQSLLCDWMLRQQMLHTVFNFFYIFYINLILIPKKNCTN